MRKPGGTVVPYYVHDSDLCTVISTFATGERLNKEKKSSNEGCEQRVTREQKVQRRNNGIPSESSTSATDGQ